jgi:hypothetical protein
MGQAFNDNEGTQLGSRQNERSLTRARGLKPDSTNRSVGKGVDFDRSEGR